MVMAETIHLVKLELNNLLEQLQKDYPQEHRKLKHKIEMLYNQVYEEIKKDTRNYGLIQPPQKDTIVPLISPTLTAENAFKKLMETMKTQFSAQLPGDTNSHVFTPEYKEIEGGFESKPFSHGDKAKSTSPRFFNSTGVDTLGLRRELNLFAIPNTIRPIDGEVIIIFHCVDPVIFSIATKFLEISYQHSPSSIVRETQAPQNSVPGFRPR